jgi:nucleoside-diphosphate-sugar epimerase
LPSLYQPDLRRIVLFTSTSIVTKINSAIESERNGLRRLAEGEQQTTALCAELGVSWTVLRPTMIYDEGRDANVTRLAGLIRRFGVMPLSGMGTGLRQPVHAEDLAIGALDAASSLAAADKVYALPGGETITYREMVGRIFDGLNKPRRIVPIPPALWRAAFLLARPLLFNANVAMGDRMAKNMVFDAEPARRDFSWNPRGFRPRFVAN